jgi:hypothetical protein
MWHALGEEQCVKDFGGKSHKERDSWEDLNGGGEDNINTELREKGWGSMHWIDLAQDRDQRRALLNTVINLRVP